MCRNVSGAFTARFAKKHLKVSAAGMERPEMWGCTITPGNGWKFALPEMAADARPPLPVETCKPGE